MEKQILTILQQMNNKLDHLDFTLTKHGEILIEHSETLKEHGETLKEHSRILSALRTGQEFQKAELSEMKLQNAKDFNEIKEQLKNQEDSIEILKDETWNNKKSILRVQKTMGLS
jgi:soluble P-type ATPase